MDEHATRQQPLTADSHPGEGHTRFRIEDLSGKTGAELLMAASHAMHSTLYLTELYQVILDLVRALNHAEGSVLLLQRPRTHHPVVFKFRFGSDAEIRDLPFNVGRSFLEWLKDGADTPKSSAKLPTWSVRRFTRLSARMSRRFAGSE